MDKEKLYDPDWEKAVVVDLDDIDTHEAETILALAQRGGAENAPEPEWKNGDTMEA